MLKCRGSVVQRFITGDYVGEGAEVLQRWCSPRGGLEEVVQRQCRGGSSQVITMQVKVLKEVLQRWCSAPEVVQRWWCSCCCGGAEAVQRC